MVLTSDESLSAVLAHNLDEEIEHAAMTLEWLRRNIDSWNRRLSQYLFSERPIIEIEEIEVACQRVGDRIARVLSLHEKLGHAVERTAIEKNERKTLLLRYLEEHEGFAKLARHS